MSPKGQKDLAKVDLGRGQVSNVFQLKPRRLRRTQLSVPAGARAAAAVLAHPEKSNRAIAAELGVSNQTVMRAREQGAPSGAPEKRVGKDGKSYPAWRATVASATSGSLAGLLDACACTRRKPRRR
jgi:hypothetical protein